MASTADPPLPERETIGTYLRCLASFVGVQHKSQTLRLVWSPGRRLQDGGPAVGDVFDVAVTVPVGNIDGDRHVCRYLEEGLSQPLATSGSSPPEKVLRDGQQ